MASLSSKSFLGVGWSFPVGETAGQTVMAQYEEDVRQAILIILQTNPGERVMRPAFGAGLNAFLFEPINPTTMSSLSQRVEDSLIDWEPRIDVISVSVAPDASKVSTLLIDIEYRVRATNNTGNLVYPFYLGEGRGQ
ncbi:MAG TPA: GPW/gp25 family protein [Bryobacteraceae bacterium]|nr:GPW/gp25 family protein [Bryobacteraceae bacterium]